MKNNVKPRVVVVGGGVGGVNVARRLQDSGRVQLTLVDRKDYFEVPYAQLRALVDPGLGHKSRFPFASAFGPSFVQGSVVTVDEGSVALEDGRRLEFDFLVLAPGGHYPSFPYLRAHETTALADRGVANTEVFTRLKEADGFWVVGGGVVGVELAGELAAAFEGVPIRLVHKGSRLVENLSPRASATAQDHLRALGVEVRLGTTEFSADPGEEVFHTTGAVPATSFLNNAGVIEKGRIAVDASLRVVGHPRWYALGDAAATSDAKHGAVAAIQADYVVKHLLATLDGKNLKDYSGAPGMALVPIGRTKGFLQTPLGLITWKWLVEMKRKDFFISLFAKTLAPR